MRRAVSDDTHTHTHTLYWLYFLLTGTVIFFIGKLLIV